jgi:hypothetical protein
MIVRELVIYILAPSLLIRCIAHMKYKYIDPADVKDADSYVYIFYNGTYGLWTISNLVNYFKSSKACQNQASMSMLNYELSLIFGCYPAVNVLFVTLVIIILVPIVIYQMYQQHRERTAHARRTKVLIETLISKNYDPEVFKYCYECAICLDDFTSEGQVTPLPCSNKHVFHTHCLKQWLLQQDICPLCKKQVSSYDYKAFAKEFKVKGIEAY